MVKIIKMTSKRQVQKKKNLLRMRKTRERLRKITDENQIKKQILQIPPQINLSARRLSNEAKNERLHPTKTKDLKLKSRKQQITCPRNLTTFHSKRAPRRNEEGLASRWMRKLTRFLTSAPNNGIKSINLTSKQVRILVETRRWLFTIA